MKKFPLRRKTQTAKPDAAIKTDKKGLTFGKSIALLLLATVLLFCSSTYYWYQSVLNNPERIVSDMLDKSMQTTSVNRTVSQSSGDSSVEQKIQTAFTPKVVTRSVTNLSELSDTGRTNVTTETIGTATEDYVQYTDIKIQNSTKKQNFDNVLNTWGKRTSDPKSGQGAAFLNEALFVVVPFGNLNADQRRQIKDEINKTNLYKATESKTEYVNGRPVLNYTVDLDPKALVGMLSKYVDITGVGSKADLDPANYQDASKIRIAMQIDVLSRHLRSIDFVSSGRKEAYSSYNLASQTALPTKTIDVNELQSRLSSIESQQ